MPVHFIPAPDVRDLAQSLIPMHHGHLNGVRIEYLFRSDIPRRGGQEQWGNCRVISNLAAFLAGDEEEQSRGSTAPFFVVSISLPIWLRLTDATKLALVDHELSHAWVEIDEDGQEKLSIRPHDVEEFGAIIARHGFWRQSVQQFADVCARAQLRLELGDENRQIAGSASWTPRP